MKARRMQISRVFASLLLLVLIACGGGGSPSDPPPVTSPTALTITTASLLPGTLQHYPYSVTLDAANGVGALTWSISPISSTALFVDGLSIDPTTGVLSGTANFAGTAGFTAKVTDSASPSHTATKSFTITASSPLQAPLPQSFTVAQFQDVISISLGSFAGVEPLTFTLPGGSLPFGLRLNSRSGLIMGSATVVGTYASTVTIQDSFSPPEVVSGQITIQVIPPPLSVANSLPPEILLNRPFNGRVIATGGIPPYKFALTSGSLPPGLSSIDPRGGQVNGTPTTLGTFSFGLKVTDSSPVIQSARTTFFITVANPLGRNDSVATATPIDNGVITASISPYIDPPDNAPVAGDNDYYKLVSLSGATVHVETQSRGYRPSNPLDTVIEIVDGNSNRQTTCRQPGDTSTNFTSACLNDDISISTSPFSADSALDFKVPGFANTATTFYVHVLDWRGDARPDMTYGLQVSGLVAPLSIQSTPLLPAARGLSYSQQLSGANGIGAVSWSIASGSLPPGLTLSPSGAIAGTAMSDGTYSFSVQATDSGSPRQTATAQEVIHVVEPVKITSPAIWPDACVGQPYSFAIQTSGGLPPLLWGFVSNMWVVGINLDQSTGVFSGSPTVTGTFNGTVGVNDATTHGAAQQFSLTVKQCP